MLEIVGKVRCYLYQVETEFVVAQRGRYNITNERFLDSFSCFKKWIDVFYKSQAKTINLLQVLHS
jgi:hypothetical protein